MVYELETLIYIQKEIKRTNKLLERLVELLEKKLSLK